MHLPLGAVHKLRLQGEGGRWSKKSTFCKLLYHRKCKPKGVGGQKKKNLVNVVCECPLSLALKTGRCTTIALYYYYTRKWGLVDVAKALTCAPSSPMLHCTLESRWHIKHGRLYELSS